MLHLRSLASAVAVVACAAAPLSAQAVVTTFEDEPEGENLLVELAKWTASGFALAAGAGAFVIQNDAEDRFEELERFCDESPGVCRDLTESGAYADPALERRYQDIRSDYRNSRWLLYGAHALAATAVVLFIVDLPRDATPDNVPYDPSELRVGVRPDGGIEASFRYPVSNIFTRSP
jgi:hypothetical protein